MSTHIWTRTKRVGGTRLHSVRYDVEDEDDGDDERQEVGGRVKMVGGGHVQPRARGFMSTECRGLGLRYPKSVGGPSALKGRGKVLAQGGLI